MTRLSRFLKVALVAAAVLAPSVPTPARAQAPGMPAGHPGSAPVAPERDAVIPAPELPPGTIRVVLVNEKGGALPGQEVKLGILYQKISEGEQRSEQRATTDERGIALFSGLTPSSDFSYRVTARSGPAEYASAPIQLKNDGGMTALLHVYPVTRSIEEASVGARGFVYVETRDDVFQFEVLFRVFNMGSVTWVPERALMSLPSGFKAFKAGESMSDVRFEEVPGSGAKLAGTFSPGQHNVSFRFQLPRSDESSAAFRFGLPPHTAELRVIAEAAPSMQLDIDGFEKPQSDVNQNGQRVLVTRHVARRGEPPLTTFNVVLAGIPTPGSGRWIAVLIASALAVVGLMAFRGRIGGETQAELQDRDAEQARQVLLDELVALTRANREGRIGPGTYESARRTLVDALSRIIATHPHLTQKPKRRRGAKSEAARQKASSAQPNRPADPPSTA